MIIWIGTTFRIYNFWQDPIARAYGVRSIPATFIIDEQGQVIAKNLRGPALEQKISELLGEKAL